MIERLDLAQELSGIEDDCRMPMEAAIDLLAALAVFEGTPRSWDGLQGAVRERLTALLSGLKTDRFAAAVEALIPESRTLDFNDPHLADHDLRCALLIHLASDGLAQVGREPMSGPLADDSLFQPFAEALATAAIGARKALLPLRLGHRLIAGLGDDLLKRGAFAKPQTEGLMQGLSASALALSLTPELLPAWCDGALCASDAERLRQAVMSEGPLQEAYRDLILAILEKPIELSDLAYDPVRVARLPHLEPHGPLEAFVKDGFAWVSVGGTSYSVPWSQGQILFPDPLFGELGFAWTCHVSEPRERLQAALHRVEHLAHSTGVEAPSESLAATAMEIAAAMAADRQIAEELHRVTRICQEPEWDGPTPEDLLLIQTAVRLRVLMADLSPWHPHDFDFRHHLILWDQAWESFTPMIEILREEDYEELVEDRALPPRTWFTLRRTQSRFLDFILDQAGVTEDDFSSSPFLAQKSTARTRAIVRAAAQSVRTTARDPNIGLTIPLVSLEDNSGFLADLIVSYRESIQSMQGFSSESYQTLATAHRIARSALANKWAAPPLVHHHIDLRHEKAIEVEGDSHGLAAAICFYALWTGQSLPGFITTTAAVGERGTVLPIAGLAIKVQALQADGNRSRTQLLVSKTQDRHDLAPEETENLIAIETFEQALEILGLRKNAEVVLCLPENLTAEAIMHYSERIRKHEWVEGKECGTEDPWMALATNLESLLDTEARIPGLSSDDYEEALIRLSLAYQRAAVPGADEGSKRTLDRIEKTPLRLPASKSLLKVRALLDAIDQYPPEDPEKVPFGLEAAIKDCETCLDSMKNQDILANDEAAKILLQVCGTLSRGHSRAGDYTQAIARAYDAIQYAKAESISSRFEIPRAHVTAAIAFRTAGDLEEALRHIELADELLSNNHSSPLKDPTKEYCDIERARILALQERGEELLDLASDLEQRVRAGPWPRALVLRAKAWGHTLCGQPEEAEDCISELQALELDESIKPLRALLVQEAHLHPRESANHYY